MSLQQVQSAAAPPVARVMPLKYASLLLDPGSLADTERRPWLVCRFSPSPSRVASSHSSVSLLQRDRVMWGVCVICLRALCCTTASAVFLLCVCVCFWPRTNVASAQKLPSHSLTRMSQCHTSYNFAAQLRHEYSYTRIGECRSGLN